MTKFLKVAYWNNLDRSDSSDNLEINYINIDTISKIYTFKKKDENRFSYQLREVPIYKKFNFHRHFNQDTDTKSIIIKEPTVIITKGGETYYHPAKIEDFIKNNEISIDSRFDILDI